MRKLPEVEEAKALMAEAMAWSVMKWLKEKKRVRKVADKANAALDSLHDTVKAHWTHEVASAYRELSPEAGSAKKERRERANSQQTNDIDMEVRTFARQMKDADDQAYQARMDAEHTFDEAERILSTRLAREGCQKAIRSWELHEKAIRRAETRIDGTTRAS